MTRYQVYAICLIILTACTPSAAERNNTGNALTYQGEYDGAIRAYQAAQVLEPDNGVLYFNAAEAYSRADRLDEAEAALQQAIQRGNDPLASNAYYNLGNLQLEVGDYEAAIVSYQEALRLNENNSDARYNLELALSNRIFPTPTEIEMQTNPEEQAVNPTASPSPNPFGQEFPTPTPTPTPLDFEPPPGPTPRHEGEDDEGDEMNEEDPATTPRPLTDGDMSVEDAEKLLEPVEADQELLSSFRDNYNRNGSPDSGKDW